MTIHTVKCETVYFQKMKSGEMTFQIRKNDRDYQKDDTLVLLEYNTKGRCYVSSNTDSGYTTVISHANGLAYTISSVFAGHGFGLEPGYCILSLKTPNEKTSSYANPDLQADSISQSALEIGLRRVEEASVSDITDSKDTSEEQDSPKNFNVAKVGDFKQGIYEYPGYSGDRQLVAVVSLGNTLFTSLPLKAVAEFKGDIAADILIPTKYKL